MKKIYMTPYTAVIRMVTERFIAASDTKEELEIEEDETDVMETKVNHNFNIWEDDEEEF